MLHGNSKLRISSVLEFKDAALPQYSMTTTTVVLYIAFKLSHFSNYLPIICILWSKCNKANISAVKSANRNRL